MMRFTENHEWIQETGEEAVVGITDFAQQQLGDIVFVELPEIGRTVAAGEEVGSVESVKAASEIYSPAAGTVTAVNDALADNPNLVNDDPLAKGWFFRLRPADPGALASLMDEAGYAAHVESQG